MKSGPKIIICRYNGRFYDTNFRIQFSNNFAQELTENEDYGAFDAMAMDVLSERAPIKKNIFLQMMMGLLLRKPCLKSI